MTYYFEPLRYRYLLLANQSFSEWHFLLTLLALSYGCAIEILLQFATISIITTLSFRVLLRTETFFKYLRSIITFDIKISARTSPTENPDHPSHVFTDESAPIVHLVLQQRLELLFFFLLQDMFEKVKPSTRRAYFGKFSTAKNNITHSTSDEYTLTFCTCLPHKQRVLVYHYTKIRTIMAARIISGSVLNRKLILHPPFFTNVLNVISRTSNVIER